jgi:hypothetical protein
MNNLSVSEGRCQFCHRTAGDVPQLISGDSAFICSDCVESCSGALRPSAAEAKQDEPAERYLFQRLVRHSAPLRPQELVATSRTYPLRQQADLQKKALDDLFGERRIPDNFVGVNQQYRHEVLGFAKLLEQGRNSVEVAPAQYEDVDIGRGETVSVPEEWSMVDARRLVRTQSC